MWSFEMGTMSVNHDLQNDIDEDIESNKAFYDALAVDSGE